MELLASIEPNELTGPAHCFGYLPRCDGSDLSIGGYFSALCHDVLPFREPPAGTDPYDGALGSGPHDDLCERWAEEPGNPSVAPVRSDVPTLVFGGRFDPFATPESLERGAATLSRWVVISPDQGHNVLGASECFRDIRDAWVAAPTEAPLEPPCARP